MERATYRLEIEDLVDVSRAIGRSGRVIRRSVIAFLIIYATLVLSGVAISGRIELRAVLTSLGFLSVVFGIGALMSRLSRRRRLRHLYSTDSVLRDERHMAWSEAGIVLEFRRGSIRYGWSDISDIIVGERALLLVEEPHRFEVIPLRAFSKGQLASFLGYALAKSGPPAA